MEYRLYYLEWHIANLINSYWDILGPTYLLASSEQWC